MLKKIVSIPEPNTGFISQSERGYFDFEKIKNNQDFIGIGQKEWLEKAFNMLDFDKDKVYSKADIKKALRIIYVDYLKKLKRNGLLHNNNKEDMKKKFLNVMAEKLGVNSYESISQLEIGDAFSRRLLRDPNDWIITNLRDGMMTYGAIDWLATTYVEMDKRQIKAWEEENPVVTSNSVNECLEKAAIEPQIKLNFGNQSPDKKRVNNSLVLKRSYLSETHP